MKFLNLSQNQNPLVKSRQSDAGTDIKSNEHVILDAYGGRATIDTGVVIIGEPGKYCQLAERSGLASKNGIILGGGVIDSEYRGTVGVVLINTSNHLFEVNVGDKIAQVVIHNIDLTPFELYESTEIDETSRGDKGFGSSGV